MYIIDHFQLSKMFEYDEGPSRKVGNGRKRTSNCYVEVDIKCGDNESTATKRTRSAVQVKDLCPISPVRSQQNKIPTTSTPKSSDHLQDSVSENMLDTSDVILAELDINAITSQACSQRCLQNTASSESKHGTRTNSFHICTKAVHDVNECCSCKNSFSQSQCKNGGDESENTYCHSSTLPSSSTSGVESQSQYLTKFKNYRPTQPSAGKIVIDGKCQFCNRVCINEQCKHCLESETNRDCGENIPIIYCKNASDQTKDVMDVSHTAPVCTEELVIGTQDCDNGESKLKTYPCMPNKIDDHSNFMINSVPDHVLVTLSPTRCSISNDGDSQHKNDAGCRYRCTPYHAHISESLTPQPTHMQSQLLSDTQFRSFHCEHIESKLKNALITKSQIAIDGPPCMQYENMIAEGTQAESTYIPSSAMQDMTGLIVDSQKNLQAGYTSDCDIFLDSFHESDLMSQTGHQASQISQTGYHAGQISKTGQHTDLMQYNYKTFEGICSSERPVELGLEICSHTQSLVSTVSPGKTKTVVENTDCSASAGKGAVIGCDAIKEQCENSAKDETGIKNVQIEHLGNFSNCMKNVNVIDGRTMISDISNLPHDIALNSIINKTCMHVEAKAIEDDAVTFGVKEKHSLSECGTDFLRKQEVFGSLQDKIMKQLKENVGRKIPQAPGSLVEQLRQQMLERVQLESEMSKDQSDSDVGPFYGLPSKVQHMYENYRGIQQFYDWQDECLRLPAIKDRKNLIYSLPTSGGKTLVAEILILQELLCHKRDALLILPFVSIVQEKVRNLSQFAIDLNFYVEEYAGNKGRFPPLKRHSNHSLYIATIEKAQSLVNSLTENDRMDSLGLVVVDELHMIGEGGSRGASLESTLMKIMHAAGPTQIIGLSATLTNIEDLQTFLNADVYTSNFRPVELIEYVKVLDNIFKVDTHSKCTDDQFVHDRICCFQYHPEMEKVDPDHLLGLVLEVIPNNSCLLFCPTKKHCENAAMMLCKLMAKYRRDLTEVKKVERKMLLKELSSDTEGKVCPVLRICIQFGIAYHHSGLTVDERKLIEDSYSTGTLCLLTCTTTLAAGVNLPAKRVILRSPYVGQSFISRSQYKQMVGRAGRAGLDTSGESILICQQTDKDAVQRLVSAPLEKCHSSLVYDNGKGIRTLLLSIIGLKITSSTEDVFTFMSHSLAHCQQTSLAADVMSLCKDSLQHLINSELVVQTVTQSENPKRSIHSLEVTRLGRATFKGPIDPDFAEMLFRDLKKAEGPMVLSSHLHLLYLVTPYDIVKDVSPSWFIYYSEFNSLSTSDLMVASLIGISESYISRRAAQQKSKIKVDDFVVTRFYLTLMLYNLWREKSVWEVAEKFQQPRGFVQTLAANAASFAGCVTRFCLELDEFWAYNDLMGNFVKRLSYCVKSELIPLMEVPGMKLGRARLMYTAGYKTLSAVAAADPEHLVKNIHYMPRKVAKQIVASAKLLLQEKADAMMEEVEALVTIPASMGVPASVTIPLTPACLTPGLSHGDRLL